MQRSKLDIARVLVLVPVLKDVNQVIQLKVDDMDFTINIVEEMDWIADDSPGEENNSSDEVDGSQWSIDNGKSPSKGPAEAIVVAGNDTPSGKENLNSETVQLTRSYDLENNENIEKLDNTEEIVGPQNSEKDGCTPEEVNSENMCVERRDSGNYDLVKTSAVNITIDAVNLDPILVENSDFINMGPGPAKVVSLEDCVNGPIVETWSVTQINYFEAQDAIKPMNSINSQSDLGNHRITVRSACHLQTSSSQANSQQPVETQSSKPLFFPNSKASSKKSERRKVEAEKWQSFVEGIESEEDREADARDLRNKQRKILQTSGKISLNPSLEAKLTWSLGKKLGLKSRSSDELIEKGLAGLEIQGQKERVNENGESSNIN